MGSQGWWSLCSASHKASYNVGGDSRDADFYFWHRVSILWIMLGKTQRKDKEGKVHYRQKEKHTPEDPEGWLYVIWYFCGTRSLL